MVTSVATGPEEGVKELMVVADVHVLPFPSILKLYGFSLLSLLTIENVAVLNPTADGEKVMSKVEYHLLLLLVLLAMPKH